jgi:hypothetical protein
MSALNSTFVNPSQLTGKNELYALSLLSALSVLSALRRPSLAQVAEAGIMYITAFVSAADIYSQGAHL